MKSLCLLLCFLCWSAVWPQITLEQEPDRFDRQQKGPVPALAFLSRERSVSRRNLLRNARFHWEDRRFRLIADDAENVIYKVDQIDSLRILALRVEFEPDEDETTTGDGRFDLSIPPEPIIDPPPHNRAYFEDQMAALAAYFRTVSDGALILLPEVSDSVFSLPRPMADYAFEAEDEVNRGLTELYRDAIQAADGAGIIFSDYDCYIIFHAGVGRDVALSFDPTPSDIPSAFLNLNDLREYIGNQDPSYRGIAVENGGFFIQEGILLPETESQEGYEIGYSLFQRKDRGQGVVSEALRLFSAYLFDWKSTPRLQVLIAKDNAPSRRVAEKCGYQHEGTLRKCFFLRGEYVDCDLFSLLREECPAPG